MRLLILVFLIFISSCTTTNQSSFMSIDQDCPTEDYFWTLVVIPDTQHYTQNIGKAPHWRMLKAFDWIVANKERLNIQMVQGLGDITQNWADSREWGLAADAWYKLDGVVGWMPIIGNHDSPSKFNLIFPIQHFRSHAHWGGDYNGRTENNYMLLTMGAEDYLFLHLEPYDQYSQYNQGPIDWANKIIDEYDDRKVVLATHDNWETRNIREKILFKHDNIALTNAGHSCVREKHFITRGPRGGETNNFIVDYQCDRDETFLIRYYVFKPAEDKVYYYTYSPITNSFEKDWDSQGEFILQQDDLP